MPILLQINVTANWDSTGKIAEEVGQEAIARGWESHIAYGRHIHNSTSKLYRIGNDIGIYCHVLQTRLFDQHGFGSKKATKDLVKHIERIKPDIIHLHNIHGYYLNYPVLFEYLSQKKVPVVWTLHDCWPFTGHCAHYDSVKCGRWKSGCFDCPQRESYPASLLLDNSAKNYEEKKRCFNSIKNLMLVTVSEWLAGEVKKSFLQDKEIRVIHNGIDIEVFKPLSIDKGRFDLKDKFVILGVASRWTGKKGLADFIRLRDLLSEEFEIILIGLNKKQISALPKGIRGIQRTTNVAELVKYYSLADVYINASVEETLGMTTIESLACGTPAIVYDATACPEVITQGCGFVVAPHDLNKLMGAIDHVRKVGKSSYTNACRERAKKEFNKKDRYADYISLYQELLKKNK